MTHSVIQARRLSYPNMGGGYVFRYRVDGQERSVEIRVPVFSSAIEHFAKHYHNVEEVLWAGWVHDNTKPEDQ